MSTGADPAVSIVIPSRGGRDRLPALFAALADQDDTDFEVIVVCDGDIDDSASVVKSAPAWTQSIVFPENRGRSAALNAGFSQAKGDILARLDDDMVPAPNFIQRMRAKHNEGLQGVVALPLNDYPDTVFARVYGRQRDARFRADAYQISSDETWRYWGGNVSVPRELMDLVGPYDEDYRAYGWEDVDWGYRLSLTGAPIILDPALETIHQGAARSTAIRARRAYASGAARMTFIDKHGQQALGPDAKPRGPWGLAVSGLARITTEGRIDAIGNTVDVMADKFPRYAGEKLVSLTVESASMAGQRRRPTHDVTANKR
ncbi:glycosyltransferase [Ornithinimicrobium sp. Arc0846-15]|nr:glycosyltransferase [Ornithinimicrobium laminariae]